MKETIKLWPPILRAPLSPLARSSSIKMYVSKNSRSAKNFLKLTKLTFFTKDGRSAPCIVQKLVGVSADLGDQVKLSAVVKGQPEPKVSWERNGLVLTPGMEGIILSSEAGGHYSLVLVNVEVI